jgi:hypothetical protein
MVPDMNGVGKAGKRAPIGLITLRTVVVTLGQAKEVSQKKAPRCCAGLNRNLGC